MRPRIFLMWVLLWSIPGLLPGLLSGQTKDRIVLVDDFEEGKPETKNFGQWIVASDKDEGGSSFGEITIVQDGYRSKKAVKFEYDLGKPYRHQKTQVNKDPYACLALSMQKTIFQPRDISEYCGVQFYAKGAGIYVVYVATKTNGLSIFFKNCPIEGDNWEKISVMFSDFTGASPDIKLDTSCVILVGIGHTNLQTQGKGKFLVDNFSFLKKPSSEPDNLEKIRFGNLTIYKPGEKWEWKPEKEASKLICQSKAIFMIFIGIPMVNWRIPFSNGLSADPGNPKELMNCTLHELEKLGFRNLKPLGYGKKSLKNFTSSRFTFRGKFSESLIQHLKKLEVQETDVYLQIDFIKYRSTTYEVITFMPAVSAKEMLPHADKIVYHLEKYK